MLYWLLGVLSNHSSASNGNHFSTPRGFCLTRLTCPGGPGAAACATDPENWLLSTWLLHKWLLLRAFQRE